MEIHQLWWSSFFWKCSKVNLDCKNLEKYWEQKIFFWDNCIWIGCVNLSLLSKIYLWPTVNVLRNGPRILHITKRGFFQLNCLDSDQWICYRCCCSDFNSKRSHLLCCLWKGPLKLDFLDIYLTAFFGVRNFGNTWAIRLIFFLKMFKI